MTKSSKNVLTTIIVLIIIAAIILLIIFTGKKDKPSEPREVANSYRVEALNDLGEVPGTTEFLKELCYGLFETDDLTPCTSINVSPNGGDGALLISLLDGDGARQQTTLAQKMLDLFEDETSYIHASYEITSFEAL